MLITKKLFVTFLLPFLLLNTIQRVHAGTAISIQTTSETTKTPTQQTFYVHEGNVRLSTSSKDPNGQYLIFKSKDKQIVSVNAANKSYTVIDPAYIKKAQVATSTAMSQAQQQMEERIKAMPPEQQERMRQMMSKMMNGGMQAPPAQQTSKDSAAVKKTFKNANHADNVNGVKCEVFESYKGELKVGEVCVADYQQLKMDKADFDTINQFFTFFKEMAAQYSQFSQQESNDNFDAMFVEQGKLPVKSTEFEAGKKVSSSTVSLDKSISVTGALFVIPTDFSKKEMPVMSGGDAAN